MFKNKISPRDWGDDKSASVKQPDFKGENIQEQEDKEIGTNEFKAMV